jgi:hypothetical protein
MKNINQQNLDFLNNEFTLLSHDVNYSYIEKIEEVIDSKKDKKLDNINLGHLILLSKKELFNQ